MNQIRQQCPILVNTLKIIILTLIRQVVYDVGFAVAGVGCRALVWPISTTILPASPWSSIPLFTDLDVILSRTTPRSSEMAR